MNEPRVICWFSCGAASAVAAKLAIAQYGDRARVVYCDTLSEEHPDNPRFMRDVENWLERDVTIIRSEKYTDVEDVWRHRRYMSGIHGAPCTVEMKKVPRFAFQRPDDIHVFGLTADEEGRVARFKHYNHDISLDLILHRQSVTKTACYQIISDAGIRLPEMYMLGFENNNCIGCVKGTSPQYWARVKRYFPEIFQRRATLSRQLGARLVRYKGERIFLDELPDGDYGEITEDLSCGPDCGQQELFVT